MKSNDISDSRQPDQLYAPNGQRIAATKDYIPGNALIARVTRAADGTLDIEWEGETKLCWDGQYTEQVGVHRIFVDEAGNEWREDQLTLGTEPLCAVAARPVEAKNSWEAIPHHPLGEVPDKLPANEPFLYRRIVAKRAILAAYEDCADAEECVTDLLADLRHLCDGLGLEFARCDGAAYDRYVEEKNVSGQ